MTFFVFLAFFAPFSHKVHIETAKVRCLDCHKVPEKFGDEVAYPAVAKCALCHPKIDRETKIPSARTVKLPDFVYFDHRFHDMNGVKCEDCHGAQVESKTTTKMIFCQGCHAEMKAARGCNTCHELR